MVCKWKNLQREDVQLQLAKTIVTSYYDTLSITPLLSCSL